MDMVVMVIIVAMMQEGIVAAGVMAMAGMVIVVIMMQAEIVAAGMMAMAGMLIVVTLVQDGAGRQSNSHVGVPTHHEGMMNKARVAMIPIAMLVVVVLLAGCTMCSLAATKMRSPCQSLCT